MNKIFSSLLLIALLAFSGSTMATPFCDAFYFPLPCPNDDPSDPSDPDDPLDDPSLQKLNALDDESTVVKNTTLSTTGNVLSNDIGLLNFDQVTVKLDSSPATSLGNLIFQSDGSFTYQLFNDAPAVQALQQGQFITDVFTYSLTASTGETDSATLTITILGVSPSSSAEFNALDDANTVVKNTTLSASGNVLDNDKVGDASTVTLISAPSSEFGNLIFDSTGNYTYNLFNDSAAVQALGRGDFISDIFTYTVSDSTGQADSASLTITVLGSSIATSDNVEIEVNNRSASATPLHQDQLMQGQFLSDRDVDWYSIPTLGNEIVHIDICPEGSSCFNEKDWVVLIFDSKKLRPAAEDYALPLRIWNNETGELIGTSYVNNLYATYALTGVFDDSLLGVIDLSFGDTHSVNIGVGEGPNTLLVAVVQPLERIPSCADATASNFKCVTHELVTTGLEVIDDDGIVLTDLVELTDKTPVRMEIFQVIYNDDQYAIKVRGTGVNPLMAKSAKSATFNPATGRLKIRELRAGNTIYSAELSLQGAQTKSADTALSLVVDTLTPLDLGLTGDPYQSTYNPANNRVFVPQVVDSKTNKIYSVTMQYHPGENGSAGSLEVINIEEVI